MMFYRAFKRVHDVRIISDQGAAAGADVLT